MTKAETDEASGTTMVVTATPIGSESKTLAYDVSTPSSFIVSDTAASVDRSLVPEYAETVVESVERSKGLGSGFRVGLSFLDWGQIEIEKKPTSEVKKTSRVFWRKPK